LQLLIKEDRELSQALDAFLAQLEHYPDQFDESQLFTGEYARLLREEFRNHFINISRIMDCVGCDKCRLWGIKRINLEKNNLKKPKKNMGK
jgi:hypothetical protein